MQRERSGVRIIEPLVGIDHRAAGAVHDPRPEPCGIVAQHLMSAEEFSNLRQVGGHRVGYGRHLLEDGLRLARRTVVVLVAVGAAKAVPAIDTESLEQRVVHAVELHPAVAQQQGDVLADLHHRAEVGTPQPAAEEAEFE